MNYLFECPDCKAYQWVSGSLVDPETGSIDFKEKAEWLIKTADGQTDEYQGSCAHDNAEVTDSESDEPLYDNVL